MSTLLKACLNGDREADTGVPVTPAEVGRAAREVADAGVRIVHVHPRGPDGRESLRDNDIRATIAAIREAAPGLSIGVSTRDGVVDTAEAKLRLVAEWARPQDGGPDFASVNWHEDGAAEVVQALRQKGIGVEAGIWSPRSAAAFVASDIPRQVVRVLVELIPGETPGSTVEWAGERVLSALGPQPAPVLLHGEGAWTWPAFRYARRRGLVSRMGMQDTLVDDAGRYVESNLPLVRRALAL